MVLGWWFQSRRSPNRVDSESCANAECPETEQNAPPPSCALELVIVSGGVQEAEVLNGTYEQIGSYCDRPHFSKDGLPYDEPRNGYRENMQIWWHDGEWRIGNTGDHWCANVSRPLDTGTRIFLLALSLFPGKRQPAFRACAYIPVTSGAGTALPRLTMNLLSLACPLLSAGLFCQKTRRCCRRRPGTQRQPKREEYKRPSTLRSSQCSHALGALVEMKAFVELRASMTPWINSQTTTGCRALRRQKRGRWPNFYRSVGCY
jgi:hypothetical protein